MTAAEHAPEVAAALAAGQPVVALESTVITHGLPYPHNLEAALAMEEAVRREGAVPATIAVVAGRVRIGLDRDELTALAEAGRDGRAAKLSLRDLPPALARGLTGGTTVAATAHLAARAGIAVFATGGLGGVHRGARETWDVSADLLVLSRTPLVVVCSGVKSILDVEATLEWLETASVTLAGFGTDRMPGFYVADAGMPVPARLDTPEEVAAAYRAARALGIPGALVLAVPPPPGYALDRDEHDAWLRAAEAEAATRGVRGKDLTPFLLAELAGRSGGRTLAVNRALLRQNAALAARIARAVAAGGPRPPGGPEGAADSRP